MVLGKLDSRFLQFLIDEGIEPGERLPTLAKMSEALGISVGKLREQLEVARFLGLVSVRPKVGIQRERFDFETAVLPIILFALGTGEAAFAQLSQLRQAVEKGAWPEAVALLTAEDVDRLQELVDRAWAKLRGSPIRVPNEEHRQFHMTIYGRLDNPFLLGLLEAYWDAYMASELTRFVGYQYWLDVWDYHERITDAIRQGGHEEGLALLQSHFKLLPMTPETAVGT
jgi:DNA-binding FadR family transcriptional regulator